MSISILYVRCSTIEQNSDRQRVNENDFDKVIEDRCSGTISMFSRTGGIELKKLIDLKLVSSISIWQIDRCGRDLHDILSFIKYTTERKIPVKFINQGLCTIHDNGDENPISKMVISILGVVAEMERKLTLERQKEGVAIAKLKGNVYLGRKPNTKEDPLKFLSKPKNKRALELLKKNYRGSEVAKITGLNINTVTKVKNLIRSLD
ncbi:recombinase family protein [Aquirufa sp. KTFRIE-69F]|uniref:Recombinase family protein n=1 Tax=Aquirufa originis TaxID=3096514 RepID=A0ABW6D5W6_9BACT